MDFDIAIIGGGFCGTMVAVHASALMPEKKILLVDRAGHHGRGLAYGTPDPDHLLNVRARQMGALEGSPGHFWAWLQNQGHTSYQETDFVPRQLYGCYLTSLLEESSRHNPNLSQRTAHIVAIERIPGGFALTSGDGTVTSTQKVVLALGNFPPDPEDESAPQSPYDPTVWKSASDARDVLIVGTGLTSFDLVVTFAKTKPKGTLHVLSRHGLLPREHVASKPFVLDLTLFQPALSPLAILLIVKDQVRKAVAEGSSWQSVIDALRPYTQTLWRQFTTAHKRQFLRHLRPFWDVHRHRCAPQIMDTYRSLVAEGRLFLHAGHISSQTLTADGSQVKWRPRGTQQLNCLDVGHVLYCTGPQTNFLKLRDTLVQNLLATRLISSDSLHMGLSTGDDYCVDVDGSAQEGLYGLGSMLKGRLYESVAVPELRAQAHALASALCRSFQA